MKKLRFCLITAFYPPFHPGGCGLHVYHLANLLAADGHHVEVVCSGSAHLYKIKDKRSGRYPHHPGVKVHRLKSAAGKIEPLLTYLFGSSFFSRRRIKEILAEDFDVIHYHNISLFGGVSALSWGRALKLFTLHTYWLFCPTHYLWKKKREVCRKKECLDCLLSYRRPPQFWRYSGLRDRMLSGVNSLIMPCRFMLEKHREEGFPGRMDYIPYFVEAVKEDSSDELKKEFGGYSPYFLLVTRLESYKGPQVAVSAFRKKGGNSKLIVVGTGSLGGALRKAAASDPRIVFLDYVAPDRLDWLYRNATALLAPSVWPEMGNQTVLQAMSCGTPLIASRAGCLPELVGENGSGIMFGNEEELIGAMEEMEKPRIRSEFIPRALGAYRENYAPEIFLDKYYQLIGELIK